MILTHFSGAPLEFDASRTYDYTIPYFIKPTGFWLSDEREGSVHSWSKWCIGEEFYVEDLQYWTEFEADTTKWCVLSTPEEIYKFHHDYGIYNGPVPHIYWSRVKKEFSGILISPYQWKLRCDAKVLWYNGWDCASACVWDLSTIREVRNGKKE